MSLFSFFRRNLDEPISGSVRAYYAFKILKAEGIVLLFYFGAPKFEEMIKCRKEVVNHPDFDPNFALLTDLRYSMIESVVEDVDELINFLKQHPELVFNSIKHALLVSNHHMQSLADCYSQKAPEAGFIANRFNELSLALDWLGKKAHQKMIEDELNELSKSIIPV